jgi:hypothetical protein
MSAVPSLELLEQQLGNLTHVACEWLTAEADRVGMDLGLGEYASPGAVASGVGIVMGVAVLGAVAAVRVTRAYAASKRARSNALIVEIAEDAPDDDHDEHEIETRNDARKAASGDSDLEDDPLAASRACSKA